MFTTDTMTGYCYFRPGSLQPLYMFELCGLLFALALYNGISLPVEFPAVFYHILTQPLDTIQPFLHDAKPVIARSLNSILTDDVPGIEYAFPLEANGLRLTVLPDTPSSNVAPSRILLSVVDATPIVHHKKQSRMAAVPVDETRASATESSHVVDINELAYAWPGWHLVKADEDPSEVTPENKSTYVKDYINWLTFASVEPQWRAFMKGFYAVLTRDDLSVVSVPYLRLIVEGSDVLDINELRRATVYEGYEPGSKYIHNFWRLVTSWPMEKQKQLLKFVTACERIPAGGSGNLTFRIQRATPTSSDHLPTSSTCFGTLYLPKYANVNVLDKKLTAALKYGLEGFGTG